MKHMTHDKTNLGQFTIRLATATDVPALAALHVQTFHETHGINPGSPTLQLREKQWKQLFDENAAQWFCFVIENAAHELIGFAKGQPYHHVEPPGFAGELNKIYLLREYHGRGLGRLLIATVARELISKGINSMLLFGDANNPSNKIYEALGAERLYAANSEFHGAYGWRDLRALALSLQR